MFQKRVWTFVLAIMVVVAMAAATSWAASPAYINKIKMHAVGDVSLDPTAPPAVVAPGPLALPPFLPTPLMQGVLKIITTTDVDKGKITVGVWVVPGPNFDLSKVPVEILGMTGGMFPPPGMPGVPISMFVIKIQDVTVGDSGTVQTSVGPQEAPHTIAFLGKVIDVIAPSPFGEVAGRAAAISVQYDTTGNNVVFSFAGGFVAGSHSTWNFTAGGSLYLPPED